MDCFYINLDNATKRRLSLEENFNSYKSENWRLMRFPAITATEVEERGVPGRIRSAEKACLLSHKEIIRRNINYQNSFMILEDDATFGNNTVRIIERVLSEFNNSSWDIIFTDVGIPDIGAMSKLLHLRRSLNEKYAKVINLNELPFFGSTAYIVCTKSAQKIYNLLNDETVLDAPYDLFLRKLIYEKKMNAGVIFPFATSVSDDSEISDIQLPSTQKTDLIWNLFRKIVWTSGSFVNYNTLLEEIDNTNDRESRAFGIIWAAMVDPKFVPK